LSTWLATLSRPELTDLLSRRGASLRGPEPRNLGELAERLQHPDSVFEALTSLKLPCLQAIEALLALGGEPTQTELAQLLGASDLEPVLAELRRHALVWPDRDDRLHFAAALRNSFSDPLGLGTPVRGLLADRTVAELHKLQSALGVPRGGNKRAALDSIGRRLGDARFVRERLAGLPASAREHLERLAEPDDDHEGGFDMRAYTARREAERVLVDRGLLIGVRWGPQTYLPAEVARALRGEDFRAPFTPDRPEIDWVDVGVDAIEAEAGVRAADVAERAATVLDRVAAEPVARLKSGGVGAREVSRLAKATGTSDVLVRLILELAAAAGLVDTHGERVLVTPAYDEWREHEPARRLAPLLSAWWRLPGTPTEARDEDGKAIPALGLRMRCQSCRAGRHTLLAVAASAPDGHGVRTVADLAHAAWWTRPTAHLPRAAPEGPPLAWAEAEALGAIARGAVTSLGRALLSAGALDAASPDTGSPDAASPLPDAASSDAAPDTAALDAVLARLLPESTQTAAFGSDLTVVVSGAPSARVRALLDGCADREGRGAATVWRFTPASIRRALDTGIAAADLERDLAEIAAAGLPQPLRYLIGDVARRHGHLRVSAAVSCVRSPDEALLAEVVAHRKLRPLSLRLLAPTVAVSGSSVTDTIAALRAAGYLPLAEGADGTVELERPRNARAAKRRPVRAAAPRSAPRLDPATVAARLLGPRLTLVDEPAPSMTEALIGELATALSSAEIRQLAHAIDENLPIRIAYQAATGGYSSRVVSELQLEPPFLVGWCHLRDAERMFTLARIQSATAV